MDEKEIMQPADEAEKAENAQEVLKDEQLDAVAGGVVDPNPRAWNEAQTAQPRYNHTARL